MADWRPMATAPKDGTPILAGLVVLNTRTGKDRWETHVIWSYDDEDYIHDDAYQGWDWTDYTHWMPLPAPPERDDG